MKDILLPFVLLISGSALACADLVGDYPLCRSDRNILMEGVDLSVRETNTGFSFSFLQDGYSERSDEVFHTDGILKTRSWTTETGAQLVENKTSFCLGRALVVNLHVTRDGLNYVKSTSRYFRRGNQLIQESRGFVGSLAFTDRLICQ
jgi:hypothetical protein